jgi:hypothetical protein
MRMAIASVTEGFLRCACGCRGRSPASLCC